MSVFVQILHHSSVSWKITPPYFFGSNVIYFTQKEPVKVKFLIISSAQVISSKFTKFLSFLKSQISFSSNPASFVIVIRHKSSILFQQKFYFFSTEGAYQITNLVKFHASRQKSQILQLHGFLLVSVKKLHKSYLSRQWRAKFDIEIWWIFTQPLKIVKIFFQWALFLQIIRGLRNTEELSFMTLNSDAKFE